MSAQRVAIGGLHTECSTGAPLHQQVEDFIRTEGAALSAMAGVDFAAHGVVPVPLFHDRATPGGPVAPACYAAQCDEFLEKLRQALPLDGVLLFMHGAYFVPGIDDPEGAFLAQIRALVGPDCVIASAWDLHGQITSQIVEQVDIFTAFRTAPHQDQAETRQRAARLLLGALKTGQRPMVIRHPVPLLVSGEMSSTRVAPCDRLYSALSEIDARPGICDANLMIGYVWADSPRATAAAVVTCLDRDAGIHAAAEIADAYWRARHELCFDMPAGPLEALLDTLDGPTILADSGDNPTAGGMGDRADVLAALYHRGWLATRRVILAGIAAPDALQQLALGADEASLGADLGGGGPVVALRPERVRWVGSDAVLHLGASAIVLTARRRPFHQIADFTALGLDPAAAELLVVKSGYLSPELHALPMAQVLALTQGAVCQDLVRLPNRHRPRPTWPFQKDFPDDHSPRHRS